MGGREERFESSYAEWLGGKYNPVRASGRAYTGFLDKTRADVFDHLISEPRRRATTSTTSISWRASAATSAPPPAAAASRCSRDRPGS